MGAALAGLAILGLTALPITAGMAILRYRLDEIDRIIDHTLADGLLTALLATIYAGLALALGPLFGRVGERTPSWAVAGATLAVAARFQPARRRIQQSPLQPPHLPRRPDHPGVLHPPTRAGRPRDPLQRAAGGR